MIAVSGLGVRRGAHEVLRDVSFTLQGAGLVALIGPNGAGKSTLLMALAGLLPLSAGSVRLDDADVHAMRPMDRAARIGWLPQTRAAAWNLCVEDLAALGAYDGAALPYARLGEAARARVDAALMSTGAHALKGRRIDALSGGETARVHLARLFSGTADTLLLDEPAAALDLAHQLDLMDMLAAEAARGRRILFTAHDLALLEKGCTQVMIMHEGRLVAAGAPSELPTEDHLAQIFGVARSPSGHFTRV